MPGRQKKAVPIWSLKPLYKLEQKFQPPLPRVDANV
jgi:hypothetical protein